MKSHAPRVDVFARACAGILAPLALIALFASTGVAGTSPSPRRVTLARAAADTALPAWQRAFFRDRLARLDRGESLDGGPVAEPLAGAALTALAPIWSRIAETPQVQGHSAVVDSAANRIILFGGHNGLAFVDDVYAGSLLPGGGWTKLIVSGPRPVARVGHGAMWDAAHARMWIFGGVDSDGSYLADLWCLDLSGTPAWTEVDPAGDPPGARTSFASAFDPVTRRWIVAGGTNGGTSPLSDTWAFSLQGDTAWTALTDAALPLGLSNVSASLDPQRRRILFAGIQTLGYSNQFLCEQLQLDAPVQTWIPATLPTPSFYSPQEVHLVVDPVSQNVHLAVIDSYVTIWSTPISGLGSWTTTPYGMSPAPTYRAGGAFVADPVHHQLLFVCGGPGNYSGARCLGEVWGLQLPSMASWSQLIAEPPTSSGSIMALDPAHDRAFLFGGEVDSTGSGYSSANSNGLWQLALAGPGSWSRVPATGGPLLPRTGSSLVVDTERDRVVLFGGAYDYSATTNEVWVCPLDAPPVWSLLSIGGTLPRQRSAAAAAYDPVTDRMIVFGGYDNGTYLSDTWALSFAGSPRWTKLAPSGAGPLARASCGFVLDPTRQRAWVIGGGSAGYYYSDSTYVHATDTWQLDLTGTPRWSRLIAGRTSYPPGYSDEGYVVGAIRDTTTGTLLRILFPSYYYTTPGPALSTLQPGVDTSWVALSASGNPPPATNASGFVYDPASRRGILFGGSASGAYGTWALSLGAPPLAVPPGAPARVAFAIAPNPAASRVRARFTLPRAGDVTLELLDTSGRRVARRDVRALAAGAHDVDFADVSHLPAGVYFAKLDGPLAARARIVVVH